MGNNSLKGRIYLWHNIWQQYVKDWQGHTKEDLIIQVISIVFILIIGMIAIRMMGKKSVAQLSLTNVLFIFVLSSTLGALITKPDRIFIAFLVVVTIVLFVFILEKLQLKFDWFERLIFSKPALLYKDKQFQIETLKKNNVTIDQLETLIRQQGFPSIDICKVIILEPTGNITIESYPEYEPIKKLYFDEAMKQILKAVDDTTYIEAVLPEINNLFEEAQEDKNKKDIPKKLN